MHTHIRKLQWMQSCPVHAMKACGTAMGWLYSFLTFTPDGGEWSASYPPHTVWKLWREKSLASAKELTMISHFFYFMFQLNATFVYYIFHIPLHVSSNIVLIMRRIYCIHTASGSLYVTLLRWPLSTQAVKSPRTACALSGHLRRVTYKEPDAVCIQ